MALRTPPSWLQNGSHPAENDRLTTQAIWKTSGIVNTTDLQITQNGGGNMSVNVSSGWAAIVGTTQSNMGTYMAYNDASTNLTVATSNPSNPRIDLVVITINDAYYTGTLNNVSFQVIAGTPASSPTVPSTPANSLALGQIAVGAGVTSILTANITNYGTQATSPFGNVSTTGTQTLTNKTLTSPVVSTIVNTGTLTLPTSTDTLVGRATTDTLTNKTLSGDIFQYPLEGWYINSAAFAGYTAYLQTYNAVHYLTSNSTSNGTLNITYASGTTLNSVMATGQAITFSLLITNSTAYYPNAFQVDGSAVTPKWSGGTAPSAGNASAVDIYQFTILKTGSATFTVLAAGPIKYA
jgi:hypothetical protein